MTLISALIMLVVFAIVAYLAYWIITKFIPAPAQVPALAIVGVLLLLFLLAQFFPGVETARIWR